MNRGAWWLRLVRRRKPSADTILPTAREPGRPAVPPSAPAASWASAKNPWPTISDQFALQLLLWAEELRPVLDALEGDEDDPGRVDKLYRIDHAVAQMRQWARKLRTLAGCGDGDLAGQFTALVDVVRMAESAIEGYTRVTIGPVTDLAVVAHASNDVASLLAELLDNATRYSPAQVTIGTHLLDTGAVQVRIEDSGIGIRPERLEILNATLAGPIPEVEEEYGKHSGFPVVHRLARRHRITVRLACRPAHPGAARGTIAMVTIPPQLLCEIPAPDHGSAPVGAMAQARATTPLAGHLTVAPRPATASPDPQPETPLTANGLPRRQRTSLRGDASSAPPPDRTRRRDPVADGRAFAEDVTAFTSGAPNRREPDDSQPDDAGPVPS